MEAGRDGFLKEFSALEEEEEERAFQAEEPLDRRSEAGISVYVLAFPSNMNSGSCKCCMFISQVLLISCPCSPS